MNRNTWKNFKRFLYATFQMASQDPEGDGALSERFSKLLQPIRDLASNWNIDVASALEDYLEDLEDIQITLGEELRNAVNDPLGAAAEGDAGSVNFAQAALLIQVSSPNERFGVSRFRRCFKSFLTSAM